MRFLLTVLMLFASTAYAVEPPEPQPTYGLTIPASAPMTYGLTQDYCVDGVCYTSQPAVMNYDVPEMYGVTTEVQPAQVAAPVTVSVPVTTYEARTTYVPRTTYVQRTYTPVTYVPVTFERRGLFWRFRQWRAARLQRRAARLCGY